MVDNHIDDFICFVSVEKIGAESYHLVVAEDFAQLFLIINKIVPIFFFQPKSVLS
jgi:hypothetical protein